MDKFKSKIISHVLASYTLRELDRKWLDKILDSEIGGQLRGLSDDKKYALEFTAYIASAYIVHSDPDPTAFRAFVNSLLADLPTEIAKRVMTSEEDVVSTVSGMSDDQINNMLDLVSNFASARGEPNEGSNSAKESLAESITNSINQKRARLKKRAWRKNNDH
ncbi:MAG: hypothetical protein HKN50_10895 [Gammaproteobacteria bacterium]|nr:hypothetical protein [Gammaproteobacteria bacterium]